MTRRLLLALASLLIFVPAAHAAPKKEFKFAWSIYTGYMPWVYAEESGILRKWADKYGIKIELTQFNDYIESLNQYTAGQFDGVTGTTMDALGLPAAGGVDTTALIIGDYSNGNDAIVMKGKGKKLSDLKGTSVHLVELSISHYMLALALKSAGLKSTDVKVQNLSDADFYAAFRTTQVNSIVAWKPALSSIEAEPNVSIVFDSKQIPGELVDIAMVNTRTLEENPAFGKALVGAWYETLAAMRGTSASAIAARTMMAKAAGTDLKDFDSQLATTYLYEKPADALAFLKSPTLLGGTERVREFCFEHGLLGKNAKNKDAIGIELPDGKVLGDKSNVKFRFDSQYAGLAAAGKL
jgi:NitT/TauT family transport system substrate-binding protein